MKVKPEIVLINGRLMQRQPQQLQQGKDQTPAAAPPPAAVVPPPPPMVSPETKQGTQQSNASNAALANQAGINGLTIPLDTNVKTTGNNTGLNIPT